METEHWESKCAQKENKKRIVRPRDIICTTNKKHERKVRIKKNGNMETIRVNQTVKVKKQKIQYIINLTNISDKTSRKSHKHKNHPKKDKRHSEKTGTNSKTDKSLGEIAKTEDVDKKKEPKDKTIESLEVQPSWDSNNLPVVNRVVPQCKRSRCRQSIAWKHCDCMVQRQKKKLKKLRKEGAKKKIKKLSLDLSPISRTSFEDSDSLVFEDISSDSFTSNGDDDFCSKIDTLIKRAKDRDRKQASQSKLNSTTVQPIRSSTPLAAQNDTDKPTTPIYIEDNSEAEDNETCRSIHSQSTLVLKTPSDRSLVNSPHNEFPDKPTDLNEIEPSFTPDKCQEDRQDYAPDLPIRPVIYPSQNATYQNGSTNVAYANTVPVNLESSPNHIYPSNGLSISKDATYLPKSIPVYVPSTEMDKNMAYYTPNSGTNSEGVAYSHAHAYSQDFNPSSQNQEAQSHYHWFTDKMEPYPPTANPVHHLPRDETGIYWEPNPGLTSMPTSQYYCASCDPQYSNQNFNNDNNYLYYNMGTATSLGYNHNVYY